MRFLSPYLFREIPIQSNIIIYTYQIILFRAADLKVNKKSSVGTVAFLKNPIWPTLWDIIEDCGTSEQIYTKIFLHVYASTNLNSLYNKLRSTVQTEFFTIEEYFREIRHLGLEIAKTIGQNELISKQRVIESFYSNLHYVTKLEIEKQGISNGEQIYIYICGSKK